MKTDLLLANVTIIDTYSGEKKERDILIQQERISDIAPCGSIEPSKNTTVVNAVGRYAIPGLWDAHIHLTSYPELEDRLAELLVAYGVTSVRDMGAKLENILAFREKSNQKGALSPRIWFAGPFINSSPGYGKKSREANTPEEAFALVDELVSAGIDFVKPYELLFPKVFEAVVKRAQDHGLKAAGHIPTRMTTGETLAIAPGYDIQHLGGQCTGMRFDCAHHAEELRRQRVEFLEVHTGETPNGLLTDLEFEVTSALSDQDPQKRESLIQLFVENNTWHTPTLTVQSDPASFGLENDPERLKALEYLPKTFLKENWTEFFESYREIFESRYLWGPWYMETVGLMHQAGIQFLAGTDSPPNLDYTPGLSLHYELKALVQAGLSPLAALQSATLNPAKFFEIEDDFGSIMKGKYADIILLDADPLEDINNSRKISGVISRGEYLDRCFLDELLKNMIDKDEE